MSSHAEYEKRKKKNTDYFPLEYYYVDMWHPRYHMPFHWHMECELITVLRGCFHLSIDGTRLDLTPGTFAFVHNGAIHGGFPHDRSCVYECIVLNSEYFLPAHRVEQGTFFSMLGNGSSIHKSFSLDSASGRIMSLLFSESKNLSPGHELLLIGLFCCFVGTIIREHLYDSQTEKNCQTAQQFEQVKKALTRIRHDYSRSLTLEDLSAEARLAPNYFCRIFRNITGRPPIDYLNYYRVERAAELLYVTKESISTIALQCGFNDVGYFSRSFRKYKGISPREFRSRNNTHKHLK